MTDRTAYIDKAQARLKQIDAEIARLGARVEEAEADARIEAQQALDEARSKRREIDQQIARLRDSSGAAWEDIRDGLDSAWDQMSGALRQAADRFH
ncbi:sll1863 family stress response protein [Pseudodonghicola flavimaris]|uniref:Coiled coil domain-containing protein n=1 Tax=Pseudodonghicola flavimaris TaxID=3050036 RepID=A0ABT7F1K1_9RHOB|nr:hypothetical protein [Pseudodonghicola flavimaris]MDK3018450.1 hypothetical protein [Pseudodonghicola flavimaris]